MTFYIPLIEIIFYIATLFAPINTSKIIISHDGSPVISYSKTETGWKCSEDNSMWEIDKMTVKHGDESVDVSEFVKGADAHKWSDLSILKLSYKMEVLKVANGYWIYPDGIESPKNKWVIEYKVKANK